MFKVQTMRNPVSRFNQYLAKSWSYSYGNSIAFKSKRDDRNTKEMDEKRVGRKHLPATKGLRTSTMLRYLWVVLSWWYSNAPSFCPHTVQYGTIMGDSSRFNKIIQLFVTTARDWISESRANFDRSRTNFFLILIV